MITMDGSELPIQDIEVGMRVLSYNEDLDDVVASKVTEVFYHPAEHTDEYFIINDKIFVTVITRFIHQMIDMILLL